MIKTYAIIDTITNKVINNILLDNDEDLYELSDNNLLLIELEDGEPADSTFMYDPVTGELYVPTPEVVNEE